MDEGHTQDEALGECYGLWREHQDSKFEIHEPKE